jgi:hypothetical protein
MWGRDKRPLFWYESTIDSLLCRGHGLQSGWPLPHYYHAFHRRRPFPDAALDALNNPVFEALIFYLSVALVRDFLGVKTPKPLQAFRCADDRQRGPLALSFGAAVAKGPAAVTRASGALRGDAEGMSASSFKGRREIGDYSAQVIVF